MRSFAEEIKEKAYSFGFSHCGIAKAKPLEKEKMLFSEAIRSGLHADLHYLERNIDIRFSPQLLLENCRSVIVVLFNYLTGKQIESDYKIAKFSLLDDYHLIIKEKLQKLALFITEKYPEATQKITVDSSIISEKNWAVKAGLGFIGKNSLLQNHEGSFFLIGTILTDLELEYDKEKKGNCGNCSVCMDACPTKALAVPYKLNVLKCLSYQTIENKNIDTQIETKEKWIYGCDICQDVCPKNRNALVNSNAIQYSSLFLSFKNEDFENLDKDTFSQYFKNSSIKRRKFVPFKANVERCKNSDEC